MARFARFALPMLAAATAVMTGCGGGDERTADDIIADEQLLTEDLAAYQSDVVEATVDTPLGRRMTLETLPFGLAWDLNLRAPVHAAWHSPQVPELVFFQLQTGEVQAVELETGLTRWSTQPLPRRIHLEPFVARNSVSEVAGQSYNDDRLYIISGDHLFVFDAIYGQLIWSHHLGQRGSGGFQPSSGPMAIGFGESLRVFIGDWEGRVRVLTFNEEAERSYVLWQWNLQDAPTATPAGASNEIYVVDHGGTISSFALERELNWQYEALSPLLGSPLVRGRSLYVGGRDNVVHVLNRLSGREYGRVFLGAPVVRKPFAFNREPRRVYVWVAPEEGARAGLYAIHTADDTIAYESVTLDNGDPRTVEVERLGQDWFVPGVSRLVGSSPVYLYLTRPQSNVVLAVNRDTGVVDWHWDLAAENHAAGAIEHVIEYQDPTDEARSIIAIDSTGRVITYRLFGQY